MSLETAVVAPALLALLALIIIGGRVALAHQAVESAAAEAARSASIARTQGEAGAQAEASAWAALDNEGLHCSSRSVAVDTSGFAAPAGTPASVSATVTCVVNLAGLQVPGVGPQTITKTMTSALDTYRER
ncbi:TadE/TadG family type IV pilus assembly protein [Xylanimonas cellulosilytica]|nr:TadE/TadG family type IV pilus assembly protein [Xylanimonas cellulosilytica]